MGGTVGVPGYRDIFWVLIVAAALWVILQYLPEGTSGIRFVHP